jgi:hypothetical protein
MLWRSLRKTLHFLLPTSILRSGHLVGNADHCLAASHRHISSEMTFCTQSAGARHRSFAAWFEILVRS